MIHPGLTAGVYTEKFKGLTSGAHKVFTQGLTTGLLKMTQGLSTGADGRITHGGPHHVLQGITRGITQGNERL